MTTTSLGHDMIQLVLGCVCVQSAHMLRSHLCIIQPRIHVCWRIARNPGFSSTVCHITLLCCIVLIVYI